MYRHIRKLQTHPLYIMAFFVLVAWLSGSAAWLGDDGIIYVVIGAAVIVIVTPMALGKFRKQWMAMISGSPSRMDYLAAPSGYRRARYAESEQETIAQSIVVPTPNRPLIAEQKTIRANSSVVTHLLDEDDIVQSSGNSPFLERKKLEFNPAQSTRLLDDPGDGSLENDTRFPKPQDFAQILERGFIPTRNNILLMNTINGYATEAMSKLHHIGLAGSSGRGKTNLTRLIVAQLLACDAKVYMVNPNFAPIKHNGNRLEDWRPIAAKLQRPVARNAPEIATLLKYFMQIFKERREREQLTPKRGADIFLVLGEWPVIVEEYPDAVKIIGRLLRQSRQYGIHVLAEFQDALIETIKGNGGTRANYGTAFFFGGDPTTAKTLLSPPEGVKIDNTGLGNLGAVYLKSFSSQAVPGRVPLFSNKSLYMLLGFPDDEVTDELVDEDEFYEEEEDIDAVFARMPDIRNEDGDIEEDEEYPFSPSRDNGRQPETPQKSTDVKIGTDLITKFDVTITREQFDMLLNMRRHKLLKGYRQIMKLVPAITEQHAKNLSRLLRTELGELREGECESEEDDTE